MDGNIDIDRLALTKFGIGQPVPRNEDPMLVRGQGRYTDDLNLPGQAYAVIVQSRYAHDIINAIDTIEARAMPGMASAIPDRAAHDASSCRRDPGASPPRPRPISAANPGSGRRSCRRSRRSAAARPICN